MSGNEGDYVDARSIVDKLLGPFTPKAERLSEEEAASIFPRKNYELLVRVKPAESFVYKLEKLLEQRR